MERPRGLEPPPTAWQAVVLPLYYGRETINPVAETFIARETPLNKGAKTHPFPEHSIRPRSKARRCSPVRLIDFDDSSRLHDRRLFLSVGEARRALPVDVNAREFFSVMVVHGNLPMTVLAAPVAPES
jgi:hypothetical protein